MLNLTICKLRKIRLQKINVVSKKYSQIKSDVSQNLITAISREMNFFVNSRYQYRVIRSAAQGTFGSTHFRASSWRHPREILEGDDILFSHLRSSHANSTCRRRRGGRPRRHPYKSKSFAENDVRRSKIPADKNVPHTDRTGPSTGAAPTPCRRRGRMAIGARRRRQARPPIGGRVVSPRPGCRSRNQDGIRGRCGYRVKRRM